LISAKKEDILIEAYSPFARNNPKLMENETLLDISKNKKKTANQILVRWALQHGWVVLPKSKNKDRVKENINIDDFELSDKEMDTLDNLNCDFKVCWNPDKVKF